MSQTQTLYVAESCSLKDIKALWQAIPQQASCLLMRLKKLAMVPNKPVDMAPDALLEARCFWQNNEVYFRKVQRRDGRGLQQTYHAVVCGEAIQVSPAFKAHQATFITNGSLFLDQNHTTDSAAARKGAATKADFWVTTKTWQIDDSCTYQQWIKFDQTAAKEAAHDKR